MVPFIDFFRNCNDYFAFCHSSLAYPHALRSSFFKLIGIRVLFIYLFALWIKCSYKGFNFVNSEEPYHQKHWI